MLVRSSARGPAVREFVRLFREGRFLEVHEVDCSLVDCVLSEAPVRQWVLISPFPLRYRLAYGTTLTSVVRWKFVAQ